MGCIGRSFEIHRGGKMIYVNCITFGHWILIAFRRDFNGIGTIFSYRWCYFPMKNLKSLKSQMASMQIHF